MTKKKFGMWNTVSVGETRQLRFFWSTNVCDFKVSCTGKVCFPKESKTYTPKITEIFLYVCCINNLESIIFDVRSRAVYISLSCIGACTALVEILPVFAETIEGFSANASAECGGIRPLLLPVPTKYWVSASLIKSPMSPILRKPLKSLQF